MKIRGVVTSITTTALLIVFVTLSCKPNYKLNTYISQEVEDAIHAFVSDSDTFAIKCALDDVISSKAVENGLLPLEDRVQLMWWLGLYDKSLEYIDSLSLLTDGSFCCKSAFGLPYLTYLAKVYKYYDQSKQDSLEQTVCELIAYTELCYQLHDCMNCALSDSLHKKKLAFKTTRFNVVSRNALGNIGPHYFIRALVQDKEKLALEIESLEIEGDNNDHYKNILVNSVRHFDRDVFLQQKCAYFYF